MVAESAPRHIKAYRCRKTYRYRRGLKLWKNCIHQKIFLKMAGGRMHNPHPTSPASASNHKLQKPSKESGIFQSLGTIIVLFY